MYFVYNVGGKVSEEIQKSCGRPPWKPSKVGDHGGGGGVANEGAEGRSNKWTLDGDRLTKQAHRTSVSDSA